MNYMEMNFCRRCGTQLTEQSPGVFTCMSGHTLYSNAAPTAGIFFVTDDSHVLLSIRGIEPFKGMLDSFGGFVDEQETAEEALARELHEELGLSPNQYDTPVYLSTETSVYPYQGEDRTVFSVFFWSRLKPGVTPTPADDVAGIEKVPLAAIDFTKLDNADVKNALQKLQKLFSEGT